jgi:hypothetical protein
MIHQSSRQKNWGAAQKMCIALICAWSCFLGTSECNLRLWKPAPQLNINCLFWKRGRIDSFWFISGTSLQPVRGRRLWKVGAGKRRTTSCNNCTARRELAIPASWQGRFQSVTHSTNNSFVSLLRSPQKIILFICFFFRILRDVEENTVRLKEHGQDVLVLERIDLRFQDGRTTPRNQCW